MIGGGTYESPNAIVVEIHELACQTKRVARETFLLLSNVYEGLGEAVGVVDVVSTTTPNPVAVQLLRSLRLTAAAARKTRFLAAARQRVYHACRGDGVREACFSGSYRNRITYVLNALSTVLPFTLPLPFDLQADVVVCHSCLLMCYSLQLYFLSETAR